METDEIAIMDLPNLANRGRPPLVGIEIVDQYSADELVDMLVAAGGDITTFFKENFHADKGCHERLLARIYYILGDPVHKSQLQTWERLLVSFKQAKFLFAEREGIDALSAIPKPAPADALIDHIRFANFWLADLKEAHKARGKRPADTLASEQQAMIESLQTMVDNMVKNRSRDEGLPPPEPSQPISKEAQLALDVLGEIPGED